MSFPLVTFNFKTLSKQVSFYISMHKLKKWAFEDKRSVSILRKKNEKIWFFSIFLDFFETNHTFLCLKLNSMWKMLSLEVLHVEIAQKLQNLEISLIFSHFLMDFQFSPIFLVIFEKNFQKGTKWVGIDPTFQGNMIFWLNLALEPR